MIVLKDWLKRELLYGPHTIERGTPGAPFTIFRCAHNGMHGAVSKIPKKTTHEQSKRIASGCPSLVPPCKSRLPSNATQQRTGVFEGKGSRKPPAHITPRALVPQYARTCTFPLPPVPYSITYPFHCPVSRPAPLLYPAPMLPHTFTPSASMICCIFVFIN